MHLNILDRMARQMLITKLQGIKGGKITVTSDQTDSFGEQDPEDPLEAEIKINNPAFFRKVLFGGGTGAGECYMEGDWDTDDLVDLIGIIQKNEEAYDAIDSGLATLSEWKNHILYAFKKNTKRGSEQNIIAHYDLGNDFFRLFLDDTMAYSSGIYPSPESSLKDASQEKFDRICRKLELGAGDHVVEIGSGWGGFALHAVENYNCNVTTTTISKEQHKHTSELIKDKKLDSRIKVLNHDYRDMEGKFDKLVSIEMIEAVGHDFLDVFIGKCGSLLKPGGRMAIQAITIPGHRYERHKNLSSWINKYIFPGSHLFSRKAICDSVKSVCGMELVDEKDITHHYARTLSDWRQRFWENIEDVRGLGLNDRFIRMWNFYLSCCEAGFRAQWVGDVQLIFEKETKAQTCSKKTVKRNS